MVQKDGGKGLAQSIQNSREGCYNTIIHCLPRRLPSPGLATSKVPAFLTEITHMWDCWDQNPKPQKDFSQRLFFNSRELTDKGLESTQRFYEASRSRREQTSF